MKRKISELHHGDIVEIKGKYLDVYGEPSKLENGAYYFAVVDHGKINEINKIGYITPVDLAYEISLNFDNEEINVVTEDEIKRRNEATMRGMIAHLEDKWEDRVSSYNPFYGW